MPTSAELEAKIKPITHWNGLRGLWAQLQSGTPLGWEAGESIQYLVIRAFQLDPEEPATVRYPYEVSLFSEKVEEIDGAVHLPGLSCLVESKDWGRNVAIGLIVNNAKLTTATTCRNNWDQVLQKNIYKTSNLSRPLHDATGGFALVGVRSTSCDGRGKDMRVLVAEAPRML